MTFGIKTDGGIRTGWCSSGLNDPLCREAETINVIQSLTLCDQLLSFDCIETFEILLESGEVVSGAHIGSVNQMPDQSGAIPSLGPFVPDNAFRFKLPSGETEFYLVDVPVSYTFGAINVGSVPTPSSMSRAVDQLSSPGFRGGDVEVHQIDQFPRRGVNENTGRCIPIDGYTCWAKVSDGVLRRFRIVIRRKSYASTVQGGWGTWKSAGLGDPNVSFKTVSGPRPEVMIIEATQVGIPGISARFHWGDKEQRSEWAELNESLARVDRWESRPWCGGPSSLELPSCPTLRGTFKPHSKLVYPNGMFVPDAFELFRSLAARIPRFNTASQLSEQFFLRQQPPWNVSWGGCQVDGAFGFSSSNGLAIKNGLPSWDSATNSIRIDAVAPHYASPGVVHRGVYSLVMPEQLVKCLWTKTKSDVVRVEISVYDEDGSQKSVIATSSVNDGLFNFKASGFTYSTSKIVIRGLVESPARPTKIYAVRCKKRNLARVFESKNPRCPSGWTKISVRLKKAQT